MQVKYLLPGLSGGSCLRNSSVNMYVCLCVFIHECKRLTVIKVSTLAPNKLGEAQQSCLAKKVSIAKPFYSNFIAFYFVISFMQLIIRNDYYFALSIKACVGMSVQISSETVCLCISVTVVEYEYQLQLQNMSIILYAFLIFEEPRLSCGFILQLSCKHTKPKVCPKFGENVGISS